MNSFDRLAVYVPDGGPKLLMVTFGACLVIALVESRWFGARARWWPVAGTAVGLLLTRRSPAIRATGAGLRPWAVAPRP